MTGAAAVRQEGIPQELANLIKMSELRAARIERAWPSQLESTRRLLCSRAGIGPTRERPHPWHQRWAQFNETEREALARSVRALVVELGAFL